MPSDFQGLWIAVYVGSLIAMACSSIYKESRVKSIPHDVWHFNGWVGVWQMLLGVVIIPTVFIPWPGTQPIEPQNLMAYLRDALVCLFAGRNLRDIENQCSGVLFQVVLITILNILIEVFTLIVFHRGISLMAVLAATIRLPLVDILLLSKFIAGSAAISRISRWDIGALCLLISGIFLYRLKEERNHTVIVSLDNNEFDAQNLKDSIS